MSESNLLYRFLVSILQPLARLLIRKNMSFDFIGEAMRHAYVRAAKEVLDIPGRKLSNSRISVVTGLSRMEVKRLLEKDLAEDKNAAFRQNRASRVLSAWARDPFFFDKKAQRPADLSVDGEEPNLNQLVKLHGGGVPYRAVLDEMLRIEAVRALEDQSYRLVSPGYVISKDDQQTYRVISEDVSDLLKTIEHNLESAPEDNRVQLTVACDNLPEEVLGKLRALASSRGRAIIEELNEWLSHYDRDQNPEVFGTGQKRAGFGIYYFEEDAEVPEEVGDETEGETKS
jgi:hypothetical protein